jgi:hypothetical protein
VDRGGAAAQNRSEDAGKDELFVHRVLHHCSISLWQRQPDMCVAEAEAEVVEAVQALAGSSQSCR